MVYAFFDFMLDDQTCELKQSGRRVALERRVFDVVAYLIRNRGRVVPKAEFFRSVWSGRVVTDASLSIVITAARRALGDDPTKQAIIATQHGRGYRFVATVVEQESDSTFAGDTNRPAQHVHPFVGRETELADLGASLAAAHAGRLQLISLSGEAGIGKTRVIEHFAERLSRTGHVALIARSPEELGAPPFWPWIQVLRAYLDSIAPVELSAFLSGLGDIAHLVPEVRSHLASSPPPLVDALQARFRLFDAIATCLERAAQRTPLAIFLDDIHRADEASLLLLAYITTAIPQSPLLVVVTYRDTHRNALVSKTIASLLRSPVAHSLQMTGLAATDAAVLLEALAGRKLDSNVTTLLSEKSGGNPFFLSQLARHIASRPVGEPISGLPADLADAVAIQIDDLSEETKELLALAAVAGSEFSTYLLAQATGIAHEHVFSLLEEAMEARVVVACGTLGTYRFSHALLREALYQQLSTVRRSRFHERIARSILNLHSTEQDLQLSTVAHHFYEAASLGLFDEAVTFARRAGDSASARLAYEDAALHYERALEMLDISSSDNELARSDILRMLGAQLTKSGNRSKAKQAFDRLARLASGTDASTLLAEAALGLAPGVLALEFGVVDTFQIELAETALVSLGASSPAIRAKLLARLSLALHWSEDDEAIHRLVEEASAIAERAPDPEVSTYALQAAWFATRDPRTVRQRFELARRLVDRSFASIEPELQLVSQLFWLTSLLETGEMVLFDCELQRYRQLAETLRQPQALWYTWMLDGMRALLAGEFSRAEGLIEHFTTLGRRVNDANADHSAIAHTLVIRYAKGSLEDLLPAAREVSRRYPSVVGWRASLPWLLAQLGRFDEAAAELEPLCRNDFRDIPQRLDWPGTAVLISETVALLGDRKRARALYELMLPLRDTYAIIGLAVVNWGSFSRHLGLLAGCLGRWPTAIDHLENALRMNEAIGAHAWVAHTQLELAQILVNISDATHPSERAALLLNSAHMTAKRLGMPALLAAIQRLAQTVVGSTSPTHG